MQATTINLRSQLELLNQKLDQKLQIGLKTIESIVKKAIPFVGTSSPLTSLIQALSSKLEYWKDIDVVRVFKSIVQLQNTLPKPRDLHPFLDSFMLKNQQRINLLFEEAIFLSSLFEKKSPPNLSTICNFLRKIDSFETAPQMQNILTLLRKHCKSISNPISGAIQNFITPISKCNNVDFFRLVCEFLEPKETLKLACSLNKTLKESLDPTIIHLKIKLINQGLSVKSLGINEEQLISLLKASNWPVQTINLNETEFTSFTQILDLCPDIKSLSAESINNPDLIQEILEHPNSQKITSLNLANNHFRCNIAIQIAKKMPNLKTLKLSGNRIGGLGEFGKQAPKAIAEMPHLENIFLASCDIKTDAAAILLSKTTLKRVDLSNNGIENGVTKLRLPVLKELNLEYNRLGDSEICSILEFMPEIEELHLRSNCITEMGVEYIFNNKPVSLKKITLAHNKFDLPIFAEDSISNLRNEGVEVVLD